MKPISYQYRDPLGTLVPAIVVYMPDYNNVMGAEITQITVPILEQQPRDYAKDALDRVRYLKNTYVRPHQPGATLPTAQAFKDAEAFILKLPLNRTGMPTINIASDGEVNFCWSGGPTRVDLGFFGNGTYSYYAQSGQDESTGENIKAQDDVPTELLKIASK